jgi:hypothetical protein
MIAEQKALTITPAKRRLFSCTNRRLEVKTKTKSKVTRLPVKDIPATPGKNRNPSIMPRTAPTADPPETPNIYGSAKGLRNKA